MSKIVQAVNSMIANKEKISNVMEKKGEFYFLYDEKHRWSIRYDDDLEDYWLYYYKTTASTESLASMENFAGINFIVYRAKIIGTKEAFSTFRDLFQLLQEKVLGIDEVLDDIIGDYV